MGWICILCCLSLLWLAIGSSITLVVLLLGYCWWLVSYFNSVVVVVWVLVFCDLLGCVGVGLRLLGVGGCISLLF